MNNIIRVGTICMRKYFKVFGIILLLNCSMIIFEPSFIDIEKTNLIQSSMSINEIKSILGEPNSTKVFVDEMDNSIVVYTYNVRDKIYSFSKSPGTNGVIHKKLNSKSIGYSKNHQILYLYFLDGILENSEIK